MRGWMWWNGMGGALSGLRKDAMSRRGTDVARRTALASASASASALPRSAAPAKSVWSRLSSASFAAEARATASSGDGMGWDRMG